jgi:dihydroflavonol-4-reductase
MKSAFITGSTGFVGLNLIAELCTQEWEIHALHLPGEDLRYLSRFRVQPVAGNILDYHSLEQAIPENVDVIYHVAGDTSMWNKHNDRQFKLNVVGTRNMLKAAMGKKAGKFVHTSSISAYGYHPNRAISEQTESNAPACGMNYNITKNLAEQEVRYYADLGLPVTIINPCNIIGPYDRANWSQIIKAVRQGKLRGIPPGTGTFAHVRDVVRAHICAAEKGSPGENYILGGQVASFKEVINEIERLLGRKPSEKILSPSLLRFAVLVSRIKSIMTGKEPDVTPAKYKRLIGHLICDDSKAVRELGFCTVSIKEMLTDSYNWLLKENLLSD